MDAYWVGAYAVVTVVAVVQAFLLGLQTWEHRRYARSCMRAIHRQAPPGRVALFAPCKGLDVELEGNLRAVLEQDHDDFEVTFIVESLDDPATEVIRRLIAEYPGVATRLVVAGQATNCGQKVHNLRAATADLRDDIRFLAFIDSDARPRPEWLRLLLSRFNFSHLGAVTGYRWFAPERTSLVNLLLYSLNCDVMSLLGRSSYYLIWGGSWVIRRDVFQYIGLRDAWKGTLSDDLVASQVLRRARLPVQFEPAAVVASPVNYDTAGMLSFVRRQYMVGRHYTPDWWTFALAGSSFTIFTFLAQWAALSWALAGGPLPAWVPVAAATALYAMYVYRGRTRQDLVATYFPERAAEMAAALHFDIWLNPLGMVVNWMGVFASMFGRQITWRNIRYKMGSRGRIVGLERLPNAEPQLPATLPFPAPASRKAAHDVPVKKAG